MAEETRSTDWAAEIRQAQDAAANVIHLPEAEFNRRVAVHNEKTKLTATATNTTAVALFGGGFILPIVGLSFPLAAAPPPGQVTLITAIIWALVAVGLHWWARTMLESLR